MDPFIVVTHAVPIRLEARQIEASDLPPGQIALGYFHLDSMVARGAVPPSALEALGELLENPVTLALAATQDEAGNIDGRVCVVLPMPEPAEADGDEPEEPWKASVPDLPPGIESGQAGPDSPVKLALLPLGNVVRSAGNRRHSEVADDAREMLANLLAGRAQDAVNQAIDDLLDDL
jgi:uncharacterized protein YejL (UPF0352 family)